MSLVSEPAIRWMRSLVLIGLLCPALPADKPGGIAERSMGVDKWKDGWELLYGMGGTRSQLVTNNQSIEVEGHGGHFSTAVGYCDLQAYCLEVGSQVSFNYYDELEVEYLDREFDIDLWMWETALYLAVRARVPGTRPRGHFDPWIKLLSGYGAGVGYPTWSNLPDNDAIRGSRVQQEGPLYGISVMNLFNNEKAGRLWFVEFSAIAQMYWNSWLVKSGGVLPEITQTSKTDGNPKLAPVERHPGIPRRLAASRIRQIPASNAVQGPAGGADARRMHPPPAPNW